MHQTHIDRCISMLLHDKDNEENLAETARIGQNVFLLSKK